jgi:hypothetical protein
MIETKVITCKCVEPGKKYLDRRYDDLWVCDKCHHFGGSDAWTNSVKFDNKRVEPPRVIVQEVNNMQDLQHLEDKIDDFRNAVHDKVLGYGAFGKGVLIGLAIALGILIIMRSLGLYTLNPIVPQAGSTQTVPSVVTPTSPVSPAPTNPTPEAPVPLIPLT